MKQYKYIFSLWVFGLCLTLLNCGGDEGPSSPPETPQSFTAVGLNEQVRLTWTVQEGVTYNLFHSISAGLDAGSDAKVSNASSPHTFTGLTNNTTYYYILTAVNSAGSSEPTEEISATPLPPPPAPQGFMAEAFKGQVRLTWTSEEDVTYDLYHSTVAGFSLASGTKISNISSPYLHTGLTAGTTYHYRLRAVNTSGPSEPTDEISATPYIVQEISAGEHHTCALLNAGVKCWGKGGEGQLGNSDTSNANLPQQVTGLTSGVTQISAGLIHTCALVDGGAFCWGEGSNGRLGHNEMPEEMDGMMVGGPLMNKSEPTQVAGLTIGVTQIAAGSEHTCAVVDGGAFCWGEGSFGRLGHNDMLEEMDGVMVGGPLMDKSEPTQVFGLTSGVTQISAGFEHTCAVVDGGAWCWGRGDLGQLGNGGTSHSNFPVQVMGLTSRVTQISAGGFYTCAVVNGEAWCWGGGALGVLGNGSEDDLHRPGQVMGLSGEVTHISARGQHTCAVVGGSAFCWGRGDSGQLGNGGTSRGNTAPQQVSGLTSEVNHVSAGRDQSGNSHTCAVVDGEAFCWGSSRDGKIGDGMETQRNTPVIVRGLGD